MKKIIRYSCAVALLFTCFFCLDKVVAAPLSVSLYIALLYAGFPPLPLAAIFVGAAVLSRDYIVLSSAALQAALLGSLFLLYFRKKRKPNVEIIIYVFLSSSIYLLFDKRAEIVQKLVYMAVISLFSATSAVGITALKDKSFSVKFKKSESLCLVCTLMFIGAGFCKVFGADLYKGLAAALIMAAVALLDDETPAVLSVALAAVFLINYNQTQYFLPFLLYYVVCYAFVDKSKIVAALGIFAVEAGLAFYFNFYGDYGYLEALLFAVPVLAVSLVPQKFFKSGTSFGYLSIEQALNKTAFNGMRAFTASELNAAADAFSQMKTAITALSIKNRASGKLTQKIAANVKKSCKKCPNYQKCELLGSPSTEDLEKIAEVGIAKKRVTIIDLPKDFLEFCHYPNNILFEVNRLIEGFSELKERSEKTEGVKKVLSYIAGGMEGFLQKTSSEYSKVLSYDAKAEKEVIKKFKKAGVKIKGLLLRKGIDEAEVTLIYDERAFVEKLCLDSLKDLFGAEFQNDYSVKIGSHLTAARFTIKRKFGCAYGVSSVTKFSSDRSGDVYSVERISKDKVLIALSDGMGSGEEANTTSDAALSLIEAFYQAGFESKTVLPLVNKILTFVSDDDFSAVDICVFDSSSGETDFIKIGAPYGFILSKEGVRYLEGSSLPLGILDTVSPTVAQTKLARGDILILLSDGVTDAFGASSDVIEFLKTAPVSNPQELADSIVKQALSLSGNVANDDMTAFCTRIY